jgi:hypothetical protein
VVTITGHSSSELDVQATREYPQERPFGEGPTLLVRMFGWRNYGPEATRGTIIRSE